MTTPLQIAQDAGLISGGLLAAAILLQKLLTVWKSDKSERSVISLMHDELERLHKQNSSLLTELTTLQYSIVELNKQLRLVSLENQRLQEEVTILTGEVSRLQELLRKDGIDGIRNLRYK